MKKLILLILIVVILPFSACATLGSSAPMNEPSTPIDQPCMSESEVCSYICAHLLHYATPYRVDDWDVKTAHAEYQGDGVWRFGITGCREKSVPHHELLHDTSFEAWLEARQRGEEFDFTYNYRCWDEIITYRLDLTALFYERVMTLGQIDLKSTAISSEIRHERKCDKYMRSEAD